MPCPWQAEAGSCPRRLAPACTGCLATAPRPGESRLRQWWSAGLAQGLRELGNGVQGCFPSWGGPPAADVGDPCSRCPAGTERGVRRPQRGAGRKRGERKEERRAPCRASVPGARRPQGSLSARTRCGATRNGRSSRRLEDVA